MSWRRIALLAAAAVSTYVGALTAVAPAAEAQMFGFFEPAPRPYYKPYRPYRAPEHHVRRERAAPRAIARDDEPRKAKRKDADDVPAKAAKAPQSTPPRMVYAVVSLADQNINIYGADGLITHSRVSSGQAGHRTPTGIFGILEKQRWHESNIYSGAPMPFMQRLTWSGVAMHQGIVPRYPASHGCIRLPAQFAAELWGMTSVGARVVVSSRDIEPVTISHARLPVARMVPADVLGVQADAAPAAAPRVVQVAAVDGSTGVPASGRRYNPVEAAALLKARAQSEMRTAGKTAEQGRAEARAAADAANAAAEGLRDARSALEDARSQNAPPERIAELEQKVTQAQALDAERSPRALQTALVVRDAERAAEAAREAAAEAGRRSAPVSVLVSGKEGLVFIKQGQKPVYEAPFTLRDPGAPLGTHLFVAVAPEGDDGRLRWSALTIPGDVAKETTGKAGKRGGVVETAAAPRPASTAAEALDRIALTPETEQKLAELMWVGGSIIVTDRGVGPEFGEYTDMVIAIP